MKDTIKQSGGDYIENTPDRNTLYITQTPQAFDVALYKKLAAEIFDDSITDDAQLFEKGGIKVNYVSDIDVVSITDPIASELAALRARIEELEK